MNNEFRMRLSVRSRGRIAAIAACSLGGTTCACDLGAMSAVTQELLHVFQLSLAQLGITVSASLWGGAAGSVLAGVLLDRVGGAFCLRTVRPAMDWRQLDRPSRRLFHGASCSHCVSCVGFAVAILGFPLLQGSAPGAAFLILAAVQSVQIQVVANWYPDTKGVPLGELEL